MKVFLSVVVAALLCVAVTVAKPNHPPHGHPHPPPHHPHSHESSGSSSSEECGNPPAARPELQEFINDLKDFLALYPIDNITEIVKAHLQDEELQETLAYLRSDEFEAIAEIIGDSQEVQAVKRYLKHADWPWAKKMLKTALTYGRLMRGRGELDNLV